MNKFKKPDKMFEIFEVFCSISYWVEFDHRLNLLHSLFWLCVDHNLLCGGKNTLLRGILKEYAMVKKSKVYNNNNNNSTIFNVFERRLFCSPRLHLFEQKYSKNSNIVKYYYHFK